MKYTQHALMALALIGFGITGRLLLLEFPNIETIMAVSVIAGALLGPRYGIVVALASVIGSDIAIGNTNIFWYTWSAWALIGAASYIIKRNSKGEASVWADTLKFTGFGLLGTGFFFVVTNFGVWHLSGLYSPTAAGLVQSYVMAIPFLRNHLIGNLLIVPATSLVALTAWKYLPALSLAVRRKLHRSNSFTVLARLTFQCAALLNSGYW